MIAGISSRRQTAFFGLLILSYLYFFQIFPSFVSPNELSRLLLTSAVVEDGRIEVDQAIARYGDTIDKAVFRGRTYSDKAFGISLFGIAPFMILQLIERVLRVQFSASVAIFFLRVFVITIPALLFVPLIARFWNRLRPGDRLIPYFLFILLFGTIAFTYSLQLISHYMLGMLLFMPVYFLSPFHGKAAEIPKRQLWSCGFAIGLAMTMEYPAAPAVILVSIYSIWIVRDWKRLLPVFAPPCAILFLMLSYNYIIFGTPFDLTYRHMIGPLVRHHAEGIVGVGLPRPEALWGLLFSRHHGLFYISPFLLFSLPGLILLIRDKYWKAEGWLFVGVSLSILLPYSGFYNWIGGWAVGPRYLAPLMPFLTAAAFFFFTMPRIRSNVWFRIAGISAAFVSVVFVIVGTITFPYPPDLFPDPFTFVFFPMIRDGVQSPSLGSLLNLSSAGAAILFLTLLLITFLIAVVPSGKLQVSVPIAREILASGLVMFIFLVVSTITSPAPGSSQFYGRGLVYGFCGSYQRAAADMNTALTGSNNKDLEKRIRNAIVQLNAILQNKQLK